MTHWIKDKKVTQILIATLIVAFLVPKEILLICAIGLIIWLVVKSDEDREKPA